MGVRVCVEDLQKFNILYQPVFSVSIRQLRFVGLISLLSKYLFYSPRRVILKIEKIKLLYLLSLFDCRNVIEYFHDKRQQRKWHSIRP